MSEKRGFWIIGSKTGDPIMYWIGGTQFSSELEDAVQFRTEDEAAAKLASWPQPVRDAYVVAFSVVGPPMAE